MTSCALESSADLTSSDQAAALEALVHSRLGWRIQELRLVVSDEGVILRGQSRTYYAKQLAQHVVMNAAGLPILANEIEVF
jgi:osmotically-inducible protein OsmY